MGDRLHQTDVKWKLFFAVQKIAVFFSAFAVVVNLTLSLPLHFNIKWTLLFFVSACILLLGRGKSLPPSLPLAFSLFSSLFFIPLAFIDAGGSKGDYTAYLFLFLIIQTYILEGREQRFCVALLLVVFICLHLFEYLYPELLPVIAPASRFYDRLIQVPIMLALGYLVIKRFADTFNETNRTLYRYANYDNLTGLLNRWSLAERLAKRFPDSAYKGYLAFLDIDKFKLVNDRYGHLAGDEALRKLGAILLCNIPGDHLVCRWGGDEFLIFFFDKFDLLDASIQKSTQDFLSYMNEIEPSVDLSIGYFPLAGCRSVEEIFIECDRMMFRHKRSKRAEACCAETPQY